MSLPDISPLEDFPPLAESTDHKATGLGTRGKLTTREEIKYQQDNLDAVIAQKRAQGPSNLTADKKGD